MNLIESIEKKMCYWCDADCRAANLTVRDIAIFHSSGLCPECWISSIKGNKKKSDKAPVQLGFPIIGTMPSIISMSGLSFGMMCVNESYLLRDCIIRSVNRGTICTFDVICSSDDNRKNIAEYLQGIVI